MYGFQSINECCSECGRPFDVAEKHGIGFDDLGVQIDGQSVRMTRVERSMLRCLARGFGKTIHKEALFSRVWGRDSDVETKIVDVILHRLRNKLADTPLMIETQWGEGYRLIRRAQKVENVETQHATQETAA